jgi:hypothetical protein
VILDEAVLLPEGEQVWAPDKIDRATRRDVVERLQAIPRLIAGSRSDLVLLARSQATPAALRRGTMIHDQWLAEWARRTPGQGPVTDRDDRLPMLGWPDVPDVALTPLDRDRPFGPYWPASADAHNLYQTLRGVVPRPLAARRLRRPTDPTTPDLEFWAHIDIEALAAAFQERVIGQEEVTMAVIGAFTRFRKTCRRALENGLKQFPREGEKPKQSHRPPVYFFLGESGMGKTHIAELISTYLFGQDIFKLTLTNRSVRDDVLGVGGQYFSGEAARPFVRRCMDTGGLGVVLFDELDKVHVEHNQSLSDAVNPLYGPLEDWSLRPLNPVHHNHTDGQLHFANTVLVFAGNFIRDGGEPRHGYRRLQELGEPLLGRFTDFLRFGELEPSDIPRAVEFFVRKHVKDVLKEAFKSGEGVVDPGVVRELAAEFEALTARHPLHRNFRVLSRRFIPKRLPVDELLDRFDTGDLTVTPLDLRSRWESLEGSDS